MEPFDRAGHHRGSDSYGGGSPAYGILGQLAGSRLSSRICERSDNRPIVHDDMSDSIRGGRVSMVMGCPERSK